MDGRGMDSRGTVFCVLLLRLPPILLRSFLMKQESCMSDPGKQFAVDDAD